MNTATLALLLLGAAPYALGAAEAVMLTVEPDTTLTLRAGPHEVTAVDRARYFRTYHPPGMFSDERNAELQALGAPPGRGTGPYFADNGGGVDRLCWHERADTQIANYATFYQRTATLYPGLVHAMAGGSYPNKPTSAEGTEVVVDATMKVEHKQAVSPEMHGQAAELISRWLGAIGANGGSKPRYFSPLNEPDASWRGTANPPQDYAAFSRVIATRLAADQPDVLVSGPCTAWPYPGANWSRWLNGGWERAFIDTAGDVVGAYDLHFYSQELWAYGTESPGYKAARRQPTANAYDNLFNGHTNLWEFGKQDGLLDLIYAYHQQRWNRPGLPMIISEFGRQGITPQKGPWPNDYLHYLYGTTVTRMWMRFMDRPEVALTVPFILPESDAGYAPQRGQALYTRPDAPADMTLKPTPLREFYRFFRDFSGTRVPLAWAGLDAAQGVGVMAIATREGNELRVLLHNASSRPLGFGLQLPTSPAGPARIARMRWEAPLPEDFRARFTGGWRIDAEAKEVVNPAQIELAGEETALLRIPLTAGQPQARRTVERFYARETIIPLQAKTAVESTLLLPAAPVGGTAELVLTLAFAEGPAQPLALHLSVNGHALPATQTPSFLVGWRAVVFPLKVALPAALLHSGENRITMAVGGGEALPAHSYLTTLRIDLSSTQ